MKKRFGTIDLGTNTFHLLIVEKEDDGQIIPLFRERQFVHLGEGGVGHMLKTAMQRGWATLQHFLSKISEYDVKRFRAVGTAALREADNASVFIDKAAEFGVPIEVIDGLEEARLINRGVQMALGNILQRQLIMDIGGGSVEFIIAEAGKTIWSGSFPLGVAVLYKITGGEDPLSEEKIIQVRKYIQRELQPLISVLEIHPPEFFIGASGSFEVLEDFETKDEKLHLCSYLSRENFLALYEEILPSTMEERLQMSAIPESRASLIVVAFLLIREVLDLCDYRCLLYSPYALKEGILSEMA